MDAIDLVREHFTSLGTKRIDVPEWKMQIYSTPVTLGEKKSSVSQVKGQRYGVARGYSNCQGVQR